MVELTDYNMENVGIKGSMIMTSTSLEMLAANMDRANFEPANLLIEPVESLADISFVGACFTPDVCKLGKPVFDDMEEDHSAGIKKIEAFRNEFEAKNGKKPTNQQVNAALADGILNSPHRESSDLEEDDLGNALQADFVLDRRIGKGGFKTVYKGTYKGKEAAIAIMTADGGTHLSSYELFEIRKEIAVQETVYATKINNLPICTSYIPKLWAKYEEADARGTRQYYLIMELGKGDLWKTKFSLGQKQYALGVAIQMMIGLMCVHKAGFIHKDIKPLNNLISANGIFVWTSDFGLAAPIDSKGEMEIVAGTKGFYPQETAWRSMEKYDVYSMGKSFEMMDQVDHVLPADLARMTRRNWDDRPTPQDVLVILVDAAMEPIKTAVAAHRSAVRKAERALSEKTTQATQAHMAVRLEDRKPKLDSRRLLTAQADIDNRLKVVQEMINRREDRLQRYEEKKRELTVEVVEKERQIEQYAKEMHDYKVAITSATERLGAARTEREQARLVVQEKEALLVDERNGFLDFIGCGARKKTRDNVVSAEAKKELCDLAHRTHFAKEAEVALLKRKIMEFKSKAAAADSMRQQAIDDLGSIKKRAAADPKLAKVEEIYAETLRTLELARTELARVREEEAPVKKRLDAVKGEEKMLKDLQEAAEAATKAEREAREELTKAQTALQRVEALDADYKAKLSLRQKPDELIKVLMANTALGA